METKGKKICPQCDKMVKEEVCPHCGYDFDSHNAEEIKAEEVKKSEHIAVAEEKVSEKVKTPETLKEKEQKEKIEVEEDIKKEIQPEAKEEEPFDKKAEQKKKEEHEIKPVKEETTEGAKDERTYKEDAKEAEEKSGPAETMKTAEPSEKTDIIEDTAGLSPNSGSADETLHRTEPVDEHKEEDASKKEEAEIQHKERGFSIFRKIKHTEPLQGTPSISEIAKEPEHQEDPKDAKKPVGVVHDNTPSLKPVNSIGTPENSQALPEEEDKPQVQSIFVDLVKAGNPDYKVSEAAVVPAKHSVIVPIVLALILFAIGFLSYWRFLYITPEYISPLVLSASDNKDTNGADPDAAVLNRNGEKILTMSLDFEEGNFEKDYYAQFAPPDVKLFVTLFGFNKFSGSFLDKEFIDKTGETFDFSEDDLDVYLSKGFTLIYPEEDFTKWGFVIKAQEGSEPFIVQRLDKFKSEREKTDSVYKKYYAELIGIDEKGKFKAFNDETVVVEGVKETKEEESDDEDKAAEKDEENKDTVSEEEDGTDEEDTAASDSEDNGEVAGESTIRKFEEGNYLIVSSSKEFLDQMKESAEGNLPNLGADLKYTGAKLDLPFIGQAFIYKTSDSPVWKLVSELVLKKFEYEGINKILDQIKDNGMVVYSKDNKVIIKTPNE